MSAGACTVSKARTVMSPENEGGRRMRKAGDLGKEGDRGGWKLGVESLNVFHKYDT